MSKIYFVSGHRNITEEEFQKHYEQKLFDAVNEDASFVVGDCKGVDEMAQKYLKTLMVDKDKVTVYHMFEEPRVNVGFKTLGGFQSDVDRDSAMTEDSDEDIAWIREGQERSGTGQNIERRKWLNQRKADGKETTKKDFFTREAKNFL